MRQTNWVLEPRCTHELYAYVWYMDRSQWEPRIQGVVPSQVWILNPPKKSLDFLEIFRFFGFFFYFF